MSKILIDRQVVEQALEAMEAGLDVDPIFAGETADALRAALAEHQESWEHLMRYGYAPGNYMSRCHNCDKIAYHVDKRAITCRPCAEVRHAESQKTEPVAWIEHEWAGTGLRKLHFEKRDPTVRDEVVNPVWTPLYAAPLQPVEKPVAPPWKSMYELALEQRTKAHAQRDALLEACNTLVALPGTEDWAATLRLAVEQARAAIKAVEGEQK